MEDETRKLSDVCSKVAAELKTVFGKLAETTQRDYDLDDDEYALVCSEAGLRTSVSLLLDGVASEVEIEQMIKHMRHLLHGYVNQLNNEAESEDSNGL